MPKVRTANSKPPPAGWELMEGTLAELDARMRDAEAAPHEGKRKVESLWPIIRIHHQRSRYVYNMYYTKRAISKELYDWCIKEGYADAALIAKWKKPGYERLCCLTCVQTREHNYGTTCICRVTRDRIEPGKIIECLHCGCKGCASGTGGVGDFVPDYAAQRAAVAAAFDKRAAADDRNAASAAAGAAVAVPDDRSDAAGDAAAPATTSSRAASSAAGVAAPPPVAFPPFPFPFPFMPHMPMMPAGAPVPGMPMPGMPMHGMPIGPGMSFPFPFPYPFAPPQLQPSAVSHADGNDKEPPQRDEEQGTAAAQEGTHADDEVAAVANDSTNAAPEEAAADANESHAV